MSTETPAAVAAPTAAPEAAKLTDSTMADDTAVVASDVAAPDSGATQLATEPAAETDKVAAKFAALSRKEKALKAQERQLAQRVKELEAKLASNGEQKIDETKYISREEFKKNPYKYMKEHDLTLEQVAEIVLNDGKETPESMLKRTESKLQQEIREMREERAKERAEAEEARIQGVLADFKQNLGKFVTDTPEYEMIRSEGQEGVDLVYDVIDAYYNEKLEEYKDEYGEEPDDETRRSFILANKQASDMVEKHLLDQEKARITKLRNLTKTKGLFEPAVKPVEQPKSTSQATNTLTNTLSSTVPQNARTTLTEDEQRAEIAKMIRFIE